MLTKESVRPGNIILFDHNERRDPANPLIRGIVVEIHDDGVLFKGGFKRRYDQLAGLELEPEMFEKFGLPALKNWKWFKYVHELQNWFEDETGERLEIKV